jgi:uncharacterized protein (TIGR02268 family)
MSTPAAAQYDTGVEAPAIRRIELPAEKPMAALEVLISPGISTVFFFDTELLRDALGAAEVKLDRREDFARVDTGRAMLGLVPSNTLTAGDKVQLGVRFAGTAAPTGAVFTLVVHPAKAERLVEVYRAARPVESYQQEVNEAREGLRLCRDELAQLRTRQGGAGGLTSVLAEKWVNRAGLRVRTLSQTATRPRTEAWPLLEVFSYWSAKRVAVELFVRSPRDAQPWKVEGATLTSSRGEALRVFSVWQNTPPDDGDQSQRVVVEAETPGKDAPEVWTLKLWERGTNRTVTVRNVSFEVPGPEPH